VVKEEKALLLVTDSNLPFRIVGITVLGADVFFSVVASSSFVSAMEAHAAHDMILGGDRWSLGDGGRGGNTISAIRA